MANDRDRSRAQVASLGLTLAAIERVACTSFGRMPITLVDRARTQLRRFFSGEPWTVEDDAALSALVGPGEGWIEDELAPGVFIEFGWRGGTFKVDVHAEASVATSDAAAAVDAATAAEAVAAVPEHPRTLGDTFEDYLVIEPGRNLAQMRFTTGPGTTGASGRYTRAEQGSSAAVAQLFREFDVIDKVDLESGVVSVTIGDATRWNDVLLAMYDSISAAFVPPRAIPPDRQYERALSEIGALDVNDPRDLARILDATTSPDAAYRRVAMAILEIADPLVVQKPWTRALEDSSRAVRRAAIRGMAHVAREDLRLLFERALNDKDACVRYYGCRGLAAIGVGRAEQSVDRRRRDDDFRVQLAAVAALEGRDPM